MADAACVKPVSGSRTITVDLRNVIAPDDGPVWKANASQLSLFFSGISGTDIDEQWGSDSIDTGLFPIRAAIGDADVADFYVLTPDIGRYGETGEFKLTTHDSRVSGTLVGDLGGGNVNVDF